VPLSVDKRIFTALQFAARKHVHQRRKGGHDIPYINHPIDVATQLATVGEVTDPEILCAALLHDTVEDTNTTPGELIVEFGEAIAELVAEVTDDPDITSHERKARQIKEAPHKSPRAKMIRLADKTCNVRDIAKNPPPNWSLDRRRDYFTWAEQVVKALGAVHPALEHEFAEAVSAAKHSVGV
jgi:guanosine-3',5'-bis(diphosphate) 3'-pyrophosphohydrolase